ncbi:unnamed protein product [Amoebophrya sp. A120]|nr:unnamed protein product [Amoebophrya sp. A120]|eukprot:GSA120T00022682001.1
MRNLLLASNSWSWFFLDRFTDAYVYRDTSHAVKNAVPPEEERLKANKSLLAEKKNKLIPQHPGDRRLLNRLHRGDVNSASLDTGTGEDEEVENSGFIENHAPGSAGILSEDNTGISQNHEADVKLASAGAGAEDVDELGKDDAVGALARSPPKVVLNAPSREKRIKIVKVSKPANARHADAVSPRGRTNGESEAGIVLEVASSSAVDVGSVLQRSGSGTALENKKFSQQENRSTTTTEASAGDSCCGGAASDGATEARNPVSEAEKTPHPDEYETADNYPVVVNGQPYQAPPLLGGGGNPRGGGSSIQQSSTGSSRVDGGGSCVQVSPTDETGRDLDNSINLVLLPYGWESAEQWTEYVEETVAVLDKNFAPFSTRSNPHLNVFRVDRFARFSDLEFVKGADCSHQAVDPRQAPGWSQLQQGVDNFWVECRDWPALATFAQHHCEDTFAGMQHMTVSVHVWMTEEAMDLLRVAPGSPSVRQYGWGEWGSNMLVMSAKMHTYQAAWDFQGALFAHELSHAMFGLTDEYEVGLSQTTLAYSPNCGGLVNARTNCCSKWQDLIDEGLARCVGKNTDLASREGGCMNQQYCIGMDQATSLMGKIDGRNSFSHVHLRATCCKYLTLFNQGFTESALKIPNYCLVYTSLPTSPRSLDLVKFCGEPKNWKASALDLHPEHPLVLEDELTAV